ncbi:PEP-CTERM sorting domain-containing protein [Neptunomonas sp. XY-337]|uniref:PEP-CTERM sorting domain-containing protein n=1 Tax=Neptunomonas sp. XY-337 TaxID=2561897 RepID=UPI0010AA1329|nr:PEP-CTERM sorting domain-containing protein [Neptunomonas sp. XY-337]
MKTLTTTFAATALALGLSSAANANMMYLDLSSFGGNDADTARFIGAPDANTQTGSFSEFGFSQMLATSIYDFSDGSLLGDFYDTNIASELNAAGVPTSGTAIDGVTPVNLAMPNCPAGQCDIDALSPLVPPLASDNEGFLQSWDLQVEYHFDGTLTPAGPVYTGGYVNVYFNDLVLGDGDSSGLAFSADLTGSNIQAANLDLFFDITFAADDFLNIWNGSAWVDAADAVASGNNPTLTLDTNVNPPIPGADELLLVDGNLIRQSTLDGSITGKVPAPGSIALFGLGLLGLGLAGRRKKAA